MYQLTGYRLIAIGLALNILVYGYLKISKANIQKENIALETQLRQLKSELKSERTEHHALKTAYQRLSETKLQIQTRERDLIQRIQSAPESDDAPIAPVLKDTLEAIE